MLKRLRRSLSIIFFLAATIIVAVTLTAALLLAERQQEANAVMRFQSTVNTVAAKLLRESAITTSWLAEIEAGSGAILYIEDNGIPFIFQGVTAPSTPRGSLTQLAMEYQEGGTVGGGPFPEVEQALFFVPGEMGEPYRAAVLVIPHERGAYRAVILQDESGAWEEIWAQRRTFIVLGGLAIAALGVVSRLLAGKAVAPAAQAVRKQNEFVAAASHEIRGPLAVIRAGLHRADGPVEEQTLEIVRRETERLVRLTDDLLFLATSDVDSWSIEKRCFSPDTLCLNTYEALRPVAAQQGRELVLALPEQVLPDIHGDEERIEQVLIILINNAIAHTPGGTAVGLSAAHRGRVVVFTVTDSGGGVPPEELERIFDRFYRVDKSRTDKGRLGLGLSVAKEIVEKHGGRIWAKNLPEGGACFQVSIPI